MRLDQHSVLKKINGTEMEINRRKGKSIKNIGKIKANENQHDY